LIAEGDIFSSVGTFSKRDVNDINRYMNTSDSCKHLSDARKSSSDPTGTEAWETTGGSHISSNPTGTEAWETTGGSHISSNPTGTEAWETTGGSCIENPKTSLQWTDCETSDSWGRAQSAAEWTQSDSEDLRRSLNEAMVDVSGTEMWNQNLSAGHTSPVHSWLDGSSGMEGTVDAASGWDLTQTMPTSKCP
jgi:hypothetical protein